MLHFVLPTREGSQIRPKRYKRGSVEGRLGCQNAHSGVCNLPFINYLQAVFVTPEGKRAAIARLKLQSASVLLDEVSELLLRALQWLIGAYKCHRREKPNRGQLLTQGVDPVPTTAKRSGAFCTSRLPPHKHGRSGTTSVR